MKLQAEFLDFLDTKKRKVCTTAQKKKEQKTLLKITGDLAVEQFIMQIHGDSKSQYLTCGVLTFTLTCASKSQYLTCGVLGFTGTCESIGVIYVKIGLSLWICIMVSSL